VAPAAFTNLDRVAGCTREIGLLRQAVGGAAWVRRRRSVAFAHFGTLASPSIANSNRLIGWVQDMGLLRQVLGCAA